jgi:hypothetical protein
MNWRHSQEVQALPTAQPTCDSPPPRGGPKTGPNRAATEHTPNSVPRLAGLQMSASIAGPAAAYAATAAPCSVLKASRTPMPGAKMSGRLVRANMMVARTSTGLRPNLSLAGPHRSAASPMAICRGRKRETCSLSQSQLLLMETSASCWCVGLNCVVHTRCRKPQAPPAAAAVHTNLE